MIHALLDIKVFALDAIKSKQQTALLVMDVRKAFDTSDGFRGGMGGMHPPHQPKSNDFGRKISLYFDQFGTISGCIPPTSLNLTTSAEKSVSISAKTFFFFF